MSSLTLAALKERLAATGGPALWRSLDQLADTEAFRAMLAAEFPGSFDDEPGRRTFLKLMGASMALAGLGACTKQPEELIVPHVRAPEQLVPGKASFYATALAAGAYATGVLVQTYEGRPTKIEGNPLHLASLGGSHAALQAAVLDLYDPDRSQAVLERGMPAELSRLRHVLEVTLLPLRQAHGRGLRILTEPVLSPTLSAQLADLQARLPELRHHAYTPLSRQAGYDGAAVAFGAPREVLYDVEAAEVIVAADCDLLYQQPGHLRHARHFAARRRQALAGGPPLRMYAVESTPTVTGANAEHRFRVRHGDIGPWVRALAAAVGVPGITAPTPPPAVAAVAKDLLAHRGRALVAVGPRQDPAVHALAHAIHAHLDCLGRTVRFTEPVQPPLDPVASLAQLADDMLRGEVQLLLMLGGNPVYDAPADLELAAALERVPLRLHLSAYVDETSRRCHWHLPRSHALEAWSDTRAFDGTASIVQPVIAPLYRTRSDHEVLALLGDGPEPKGYDLVRATWSAHPGGELGWRRALHDGVLEGTAAAPAAAVIDVAAVARAAAALANPETGAGAYELTFDADPNVGDGRAANNGWLQELPKPITRLTWDNAALISPKTAAALDLRDGDVVELQAGERRLRAPVWTVPGQADGSLHLALGYGRAYAGRLGSGAGVDAYPLRLQDHLWATAVSVRPLGERRQLACTQDHSALEGRSLLRVLTDAELRADPQAAQRPDEHGPRGSLYPPVAYEGNQWGMAIDLDSCIGCNACTMACTAENNIAVVGKDQVARGREMHWIRVDRYFSGPVDEPAILHQPVPCMHCENAPCEVVCPVNATVHGPDGLNQMVYNRCVGTRYCSNNCPYKVRRFNFGLYSDWDTPSLQQLRNPNVTVRSRGVMEKCTYCVQRINAARLDARKSGRRLADGEVVTACQQACPTQAIVFGDINHPGSAVARAKQSPRSYDLLAELNTRPRTSYLARVTRPNPDLGET